MHLEYIGPGPELIAQSGSYDEFETQFNFEDYVITFMGRVDEEWVEVAFVELFDGVVRIESSEGGGQHIKGAHTVFITRDA